MNIDKQALREEFRLMQAHYSDPADRARQVIYIAAEALLDELDKKQQYIKLRDQENEDIALTVGKLRVELEHYKSREERVTKLVLDNSTSWDVLYEKLEAAERRIAELEAREVTLPPTFWYEHDDLSRDVPVLDKRLVKKAIRAAGIGVKGE
ncbi:ead/Ea22-like family protein [Salmonella enterica subsp. enterica]|nr:ead/Ea22-like family protein [Salmonella enterica subsp. enterica]